MLSNSFSDLGHRPGSPLYLAVRQRLAEAISTGEWSPGDAIPAEKKLCERYSVSMGTLRRAVDQLIVAGLLVRQQGRGTFVAQHSQDRYLFSFFHVVRQDGRKEYPAVRFLRCAFTSADRFAAEALSIKTGARLLHLSNELSLAGEVAAIDEIFLPVALFPDISEQRLRERRTTLYQLYQDEFAITVVRTAERLRAAAATSSQARQLKVAVDSPLLQIIRVAYSFDDQPVELRRSFVNTLRCEYRPDPYYRERE